MTGGVLIRLTLAAACGSTYAQAVYQCPGPAGQKVFQNAPCTGGTRLNVKPAAPLGGTMLGTTDQARAAAVKAERDAAVAKRDEQVRDAIQQRRVLIGMTESEMIAALGAPHHVNVSSSDRGVQRQHVYRPKSGRDSYVYTYDGVVRSVDWTEVPEKPPTLQKR